MNRSRRFFKDSLLIVFFGILSALFGYVIRLILSRNLSLSDFGLFYAVFSFVGIFAILKNLGLPGALIKIIPEFSIKGEKMNIKKSILFVLLINFIASLFIALFFIIFSNYLSQYYFKDYDSIKLLYLLAGYFIFFSLIDVITASFLGLQQNFIYLIKDVFLNVLVLSYLFLFDNFDVFTPAFAYLFATMLLFLLFGISLFLRNKEIFCSPFNFDKKLFKEIFKFGLPMFLILMGAKLIQFIDISVLTYFRPLEEVGVYNAVLPTALVLIFLVDGVGAILAPIISELKKRHKENTLILVFKILQKYAFFTILPLSLVVYSYSESILSVLFGQDYVSGAFALKLLMIGSVFYSVHRLNVVGVSYVGKPGVVTKIVLFLVFFDFVLNLFLVPKYGINGAAFSTSLTFILASFLSLISVKKYIGGGYPVKYWSLTILVGLVTLLLIESIKGFTRLPLFLDGIVVLFIAALFYLSLGLILNILNKDDLHMIL